MPLISIIVPVYNKKDYLPACLDSILTWGGDGKREIILVDDGSTDGSDAILDEYKAANPEIIVVHQSNAGVSNARNKGLSLASGEYVTFVDADDEVVQDTLDKVLPYILNEKKTDIFITSAVKEGQNTQESIFEDRLLVNEDASAAFTFILTGGTEEKRIPRKATIFMSGCKEKFYRRLFLNENKIYFDTELFRNEDVLFSCLVYHHASSIHFLPITTYINKEDPNGITKGMNVVSTVENHKRFVEKFDLLFKSEVNVQFLSNFYFHQSLVISYELYRALRNKKLSEHQYKMMNKDWYANNTNSYMLNHLDSSRLPMVKRVAYYLMKMHMYRLVGVEMDLHHKRR